MSKTLSRVSIINARRRENYRKMREAEGMSYTPAPHRRIDPNFVDVNNPAEVGDVSRATLDRLEKALREKV